ncbi:hypothetical protein HC761_02570 [bacterium]|nr:hypothetical protein [bacterium]
MPGSGLQAELRVQAEGVQVGNYEVYANQLRVGKLQVAQSASGNTFGEIVFRSQVSVGSYPLEFDPNGAQIELRRVPTQVDYRFTIDP